MCSNAKIGKNTVTPGASILIYGRHFLEFKTWNPSLWNARVEKIDTSWRKLERVYLHLDAFYEGRGLFKGEYVLFVAGLYDKPTDSFMIVTRPAIELIRPYHHRMPVCLGNPEAFIWNNRIVEIDYSELKLAA